MKLPPDVEAKCLQLAGLAGKLAVASDLWPLLEAARAAGHADPVPEHRFHVAREWRFDVAWPDVLVAFEREGGKFQVVKCPGCGHSKTVFVSRHHSKAGLEADAEKYNAAAAMGWAVIRATPGMLRDGRAATALLATLASRRRT